MVPLDRFRNLAKRQYKTGQEYVLIDHKGRSEESHKHYFASIRKGWENLPEDDAKRYRSPEFLRKWCLVKEGYADHVDHVCRDDDEASHMIMLVRRLDQYAIITRASNILTIWFAQSQDRASMGHKVFEESKARVLECIAAMCGISLEELTKNSKETT